MTTPEARERALKERTMRRIYLVHNIRLALHPRFLKLLVVAAFFWKTTAYISYSQVIANAPEFYQLKDGFNFAQAALANTETTAFAFLAAMTTVAMWLFFDLLYRPRESY